MGEIRLALPWLAILAVIVAGCSERATKQGPEIVETAPVSRMPPKHFVVLFDMSSTARAAIEDNFGQPQNNRGMREKLSTCLYVFREVLGKFIAPGRVASSPVPKLDETYDYISIGTYSLHPRPEDRRLSRLVRIHRALVAPPGDGWTDTTVRDLAGAIDPWFGASGLTTAAMPVAIGLLGSAAPFRAASQWAAVNYRENAQKVTRSSRKPETLFDGDLDLSDLLARRKTLRFSETIVVVFSDGQINWGQGTDEVHAIWQEPAYAGTNTGVGVIHQKNTEDLAELENLLESYHRNLRNDESITKLSGKLSPLEPTSTSRQFVLRVRHIKPPDVEIDNLVRFDDHASLDRVAIDTSTVVYHAKYSVKLLRKEKYAKYDIVDTLWCWHENGEEPCEPDRSRKPQGDGGVPIPVYLEHSKPGDAVGWTLRLRFRVNYNDPVYGRATELLPREGPVDVAARVPPVDFGFYGLLKIDDDTLRAYADSGAADAEYVRWRYSILSRALEGLLVVLAAFFVFWPPLRVRANPPPGRYRHPAEVVVDFRLEDRERPKAHIIDIPLVNAHERARWLLRFLISRRFALDTRIVPLDETAKAFVVADSSQGLGFTPEVKPRIAGRCRDGDNLQLFLDCSALTDFGTKPSTDEQNISALWGVELLWRRIPFLDRLPAVIRRRFRRKRISILDGRILEVMVPLRLVPQETHANFNLEMLASRLMHRRADPDPKTAALAQVGFSSSATNMFALPQGGTFQLVIRRKGEALENARTDWLKVRSLDDQKTTAHAGGVIEVRDIGKGDIQRVAVSLDFDTLPNPLAGHEDYVLSLLKVVRRGRTWESQGRAEDVIGKTFEEEFRLFKDERFSSLVLTMESVEGKGEKAVFCSDATTAPAELEVKRRQAMEWGPHKKDAMGLARFRIKNTAGSGRGHVWVKLDDLQLMEPGTDGKWTTADRPRSLLGTAPAVAKQKSRHLIGWSVKGGARSIAKAPLDQPIVVRDDEDDRVLTVNFLPQHLRDMHRLDMRLRLQMRLTYGVKPDGEPEETQRGEVHATLDFNLQKSMGAAYVAIDWGSRATCVAFAERIADISESMVYMQEEQREELRRRYLWADADNPVKEARAREAVDLDRREALEQPPLLLSYVMLPAAAGGGWSKAPLVRPNSREFVLLPVPGGELIRSKGGKFIAHLKDYIGCGQEEVNEDGAQVAPSRPVRYLDEDGVATTDPVKTRDLVVATFKNLKEYIDGALEARGKRDLFDKLVITHPNTFTLEHVRLLRDLVREAFPDKWVHTLSESDAAAIYYSHRSEGLWKNRDQPTAPPDVERILVYDIGAGTLDMSLLKLSRNHGVPCEIESRRKLGLARAGNALDQRLARVLHDRLVEIQRAAKEVASQEVLKVTYGPTMLVGPKPNSNPETMRLMREIWRQILSCKEELSKSARTEEKGKPLEIAIGCDEAQQAGFLTVSGPAQDNPSILEKVGLRLDGEPGPEQLFVIELTPHAVSEHQEVTSFVQLVAKQAVTSFLAPALADAPEEDRRIDTVLFTGRTSAFPGIRENVADTVSSLTGVPVKDIFFPNLRVENLKQAVCNGGLLYGLHLRRNAMRFVDYDPVGRCGVLVSRFTRWDYEPLFGGFNGDRTRFEEVKLDALTTFLPKAAECEMPMAGADEFYVVTDVAGTLKQTVDAGRTPKHDEDYHVVAGPFRAGDVEGYEQIKVSVRVVFDKTTGECKLEMDICDGAFSAERRFRASGSERLSWPFSSLALAPRRRE